MSGPPVVPPPPPSGQQFQIVHGDQRVTIVEVGGGIREYVAAERPVLDPYPLAEMCDGAHGAPLIPWPNRLADGRYSFAVAPPITMRYQVSSATDPSVASGIVHLTVSQRVDAAVSYGQVDG